MNLSNFKLAKQIFESYVLRLALILVNLILVPISISYLGKESYGAWVTILSVVNWVLIGDMGIGNGLRNYVTSNSNRNTCNVKGALYYAGNFLKSVSKRLCVFGILVSLFLYFSGNIRIDVFVASLICFVFIVYNLHLSIFVSALHALKETPKVTLFQLLSACITLIFIIVLTTFNVDGKIFHLAIIYGFSIISVSYLSKNLIWIKYGLRAEYFENEFTYRQLRKGGLLFFGMQLSLLVIMSTDNILVAKLFNTSMVTEYYIYDRFYSIYNLAFTILLVPVWAYVSEAISKKQSEWLRKLIIYLLIIFFFSIPFLFIAYCLFDKIVVIWLGERLDSMNNGFVNISFVLGALMLAWNGIFSTIINGMGKVTLQLYCLMFAALINIPLSYFFVQYVGFGVEGVKLATILSLAPTSLVLPIQVYYRLRKSYD